MAFGVEQQIAWLKVSVEQVSRVHVLQTFEHLVDNVLLVDVLQYVGADHSMKICVHEVKH